jgi:chemotaxis family two-component system sensor kinase Cph1
MANRPAKLSPEEMETELDRLWRREVLFDATQTIGHFGYCDWDYGNGRIKSCTEEYARIFGMSIEEVIASQDSWDKVLEQIHPDDRELYAKSYQKQFSRGSHEVEYRFFRKDGEIRHAKEVAVVYYDSEDNEIDSMGLVQDITELKRRQQDLENSDTIVRQFELIPDIGHYIWNLDAEKYKYISPGFARIFGVSVNEILQRVTSLEDDIALLHEEDQERMAKIYADRKIGNDADAEYRVRRTDGEIRWISEQSIAIWDSASKEHLSIGVMQDITGLKNIEQTLLASRDSLEAVVEERTQLLADTIKQLKQEIKEREMISSELEIKNAELERFAYTVSHDLKSPLVTIKGYVGLISKDIAANKMHRLAEDFEKINTATDTMGTLLNDVLELSRLGQVMGDPVTCDLSEIARQAIDLVGIKIDDLGIKIVVEDMLKVKGSEVRLVEVFLNLIENAIKFMGDQKSPRVHIGSVEKDGMICCYVRDNGEGIATQYQNQIFELFERLNTDVEGTGVGLALVKRIIEGHGGEIWVESEGIGRGSKLSFTLPMP